LVAAKAKEQWSVYAPGPGTAKLTKFTNTSAAHFYLELEQAKDKGVAWSREETSLGYVSIAAPIIEKLRVPRLAVAMLLPKQILAFCDLGKLEKDIKTVAKRLENA
jgi:DNA-binding IclR family transcriptional regulator